MQKLAQPVKLSYLGPFFRHERPQAGRYRQFHQLGVEAIGTDSPLADAEVICCSADLLAELGRARGRAAARQPRLPRRAPRLPGGAEGPPARARGRALQGRARADRHQPAARLRLRRRGDAGGDGERADASSSGWRARTPSTSTRCGRCSTRPASPTTIDPTLVRGLDYYTRTIFSFVCDRLGAQSEIGGGGRYDGLIEQLGGPADAGGRLGGGDRADPAGARRGGCRRPGATPSSPSPTGSSAQRALALAPASCATPGLSAEVDLAGRGLKGQLKHADRIGAAPGAHPRGRRQRPAARHGERRAARRSTRQAWSRR